MAQSHKRGKSKSWKKTDTDRKNAITSSKVYVKAGLAALDPSKDKQSPEYQLLLNSDNWYQFFTRKLDPGSSDWLADDCPGVKDRPGQTFYSYSRYPYLRYPKKTQNVIGLQYIGNLSSITLGYFNDNASNTPAVDSGLTSDEKSFENDNGGNDQRVSLLTMLSEIIEEFYGMKVRLMPTMSTDGITTRFNDFSNTYQLHTQAIHPKLQDIRLSSDNSVCFN